MKLVQFNVRRRILLQISSSQTLFCVIVVNKIIIHEGIRLTFAQIDIDILLIFWIAIDVRKIKHGVPQRYLV